jgi:DNA-binding NarL/FixJ family response regulator
MKKIHLLLVDDQVLFVESLKRVVENIAKDMVVDDVAHNGEEAIAKVARYRPDIILMDVRMPQMDGVQATRAILQKFPDTRVIILTTYDDDEYIREALQAGAVGYLLKDLPPRELVPALRAIGKGAFLISPSIADRLLRQTRIPQSKQEGDTQGGGSIVSRFDPLSKREKEVLCCIANGLTNREIADRLFIAEQTVKNHVSSIYSKVGENDRFRLIDLIREYLDGDSRTVTAEP